MVAAFLFTAPFFATRWAGAPFFATAFVAAPGAVFPAGGVFAAALRAGAAATEVGALLVADVPGFTTPGAFRPADFATAFFEAALDCAPVPSDFGAAGTCVPRDVTIPVFLAAADFGLFFAATLRVAVCAIPATLADAAAFYAAAGEAGGAIRKSSIRAPRFFKAA